jgi:hypothetical protein
LKFVEELLRGLSLLIGKLGDLSGTCGSGGLVHLSGFSGISRDTGVETREEGLEVYILAELGQPGYLGVRGLALLCDEILGNEHA